MKEPYPNEEKLPPAASESLFRAVFERTADAVIVSDPTGQGRVLDVNPAACHMFGYTKEEFLKLDRAAMVDQAGSALEHLLQERGETGQAKATLRYRRKDGSSFEGEVSSSFLDADNTGAAVTIIRDITGRTRTETVLRESEEKYRSLFENLNSAALLIEPILDGTGRLVDFRYLVANASVEKHLGKTPDEMVGKLYSEVWHAGRNPVFDVYEKVLSSGEPFKGELLLPATGRHYDMSIFRPAPGRFALILSDITGRKRAEEELRESEERFRVAQEVSPDGFLIFRPVRDDAGVVTDFLWMYENDAAARMNDTDPKEVCGKRVSEVLPHHDQSPFHKAYKEVAETGEVRVVEEAFYDQDSFRQGRWFRVAAVPTVVGDVAILVQDITERKRAEEALRQSGRNLARSQEIAHLGSWAWDIGEDRLQWSDEAWRIFGLEPQQFAPHYEDFIRFVHPEDRKKVEKAVEESLTHGDYDIEYRMVREDGTVGWAHSQGEVTFDAMGKPTAMDGTIHDITRRKQAEEDLRELNATLENRVAERAAEALGALETAGKERQRLYGVLETLPVYVILLTADYHVPFANHFFRSRFGESEGHRCYEYLFGRTEPCEICETYTVLKTNAPHHWYWTGPDKRDYDIYDYPFVDADGSMMILEMGIDITEQKQAQTRIEGLHHAVNAERERFLNVLETLPMILTLLRPDHRVEWVNKAYRDALGDNVGLLCYASQFGRDKPCEECQAFVPLETGRLQNWEWKLPDGRIFDIYDFPFSDIDGSPMILEMDIDITEQRHAEEEKGSLEAQLRQAQKLEALGTLSGGIAHDFNNILAAIIGFSEIAQARTAADPKANKAVQRILDAGLRGRELVKQMLMFSRKTEREMKPLLLTSVVKEAMKLLRASIPTTISIKVSVRSESGLILGDPVQVQQVLMNLCTNAAFAMQERGGVLTVELSDFSVNGDGRILGLKSGLYMRLVVSDTGAGIAPEHMDKIFDPFFTTKKLGEGTGLGLSVVHGIVSQHGGVIKVESEPGKGSVFTVYFPKIKETRSMETTLDQSIATGDERILFVDDEEALVEMGEELLAGLGYHVTSKMSSTDALALFRLDPSQFDLILTDQTMPDMTGLELAREVMAVRADIPVVLCTGFSHLVDADKAKEAGIKAFAMKPLTKKEIARTVRKVLDENKKHG